MAGFVFKMHIFIFFVILTRANADSVSDDDSSYDSVEHGESEEVKDVEEIKEVKDLKKMHAVEQELLLVRNFTVLMAAIVKFRNDKLRPDDMSDIRRIFADFLDTFLLSLNTLFDYDRRYAALYTGKVEDGLPESTVKSIKNNIRKEHPDIGDEAINAFVFSLRQNLFDKKNRLDNIIKRAKKYEEEIPSTN